MTRPVRRLSDGGDFEAAAGYSRAVRQGDYISVSGTAALGSDGALFPGDAYRQTAEALGRALAAALELGATRETILRTRLLLALGCDWQEVVRAHREAFGSSRPANTTYFVAGFVPDGILVEVELDAVAADHLQEVALPPSGMTSTASATVHGGLDDASVGCGASTTHL